MKTSLLPMSVLLILSLLALACTGASRQPRHVLIVGAGINGAATAYFLRNISRELGLDGPGNDLHITVAEQSDRIGGRVYSSTLSGDATPSASGRDHKNPIELGASVYHDVNAYMRGFVEELGLATRHPYMSSKLGVFDGHPDGIVFQESDLASDPEHGMLGGNCSLASFVRSNLPESFWKALDLGVAAFKAIGRYSLDPFHAQGCVEVLVGRLLEVYRMQRGPRGEAFGNARDLLRRLGLLEAATETTLEQYLLTGRLSKKLPAVCTPTQTNTFIDEIAHSMTLINYGQVPHEITALAGGVAMKGRGSEVQSIEGGNEILVHELLRSASVDRVVLGASVRYSKPIHDGSASQHASEQQQHFTVSGAGATELMTPVGQRYDAVIFAHPLLLGRGTSDDSGDVAAKSAVMKVTHVSIVQGVLNATTLFASSTDASANFALPTIITMTARGRRFLGGIRSIGLLRGTTDHFKVFSDSALSAAWLEREIQLFMPGTTVRKAHVWQGAYPRYATVEVGRGSGSTLGLESSFVLSSVAHGEASVYYAGALESFVSTMETQCIGARNTALLVIQQWQRVTKTAPKDEATLNEDL